MKPILEEPQIVLDGAACFRHIIFYNHAVSAIEESCFVITQVSMASM